MNRPVILCSPVRNHLHILKRTLPTWELFADHIVIADQRSTDGTKEFLETHSKVSVIANESQDFSEAHRIQLMLDAARRISDAAVLLFLDVDETLSANILSSVEWESFRRSDAGTTGYFQWVQVWRSVLHYIAHGDVGKPGFMPFGFVDDGRLFEGGKVMHGPRGPGMWKPTRSFYFNQVVNLHLFLVDLDLNRKKQNYFKLFWLRKGGKYFYTNRNHMIYDHIGLEHCEPSPLEWYAEYIQKGIDIVSVESPTLTWYDVEILQHMHKHGTRSLALLDIWNQDWEHLRQLALGAGNFDIPRKPIRTPTFARRYTDWTLGRTSLRRAMRSGGRFLKRKILP